MNYQNGNLSSPSFNRRYGSSKEEYRREGGSSISGSSGSTSHHHHRKNDGRSRSPEYEYTSNRYGGNGSAKSDEARIQSLSSQLASAQSQVLKLEAEVSNARTAKNYAEHKHITLQRDLNSLQKRNSEVLAVMKTLEAGVEALQKEKVSLVMERDELRAKLESAEKNGAMLTEQVTYLNERNSTLSKKCVDLLDGSKEFREKASAYEEELKRIKPRYEEMDAKFGTLNEENKAVTSRLSMYEMRERFWIREKTELEQRHKDTIERWQRSIAELRAQHESDKERVVRAERERMARGGIIPSSNPNPNGPSRAEMEKVERHIKDLNALLESIQLRHTSELSKYRAQIAELEAKCMGDKKEQGERQQQQCNGTGKGEEEIILIEEDDHIPNKTPKGGGTAEKEEVGKTTAAG